MSTRNWPQCISLFRCEAKRGVRQVVERGPKKARRMKQPHAPCCKIRCGNETEAPVRSSEKTPEKEAGSVLLWARKDRGGLLAHNARITSLKRSGATLRCRYDFVRQKNSRPLPQSAREVGQANRKIMTTEAKQRRVRRKFTARPSVQHASCRAGTAAFRASGSKGNKTTRAQQPLLLKLG